MAKDSLTIEINADDKASKKLGNVSNVLGTLGKTAAVGATAFVGAAAAIGGGMVALAMDAAPVEGIQNAFDGLVEASGRLPTEMLTNLELASAGMVSQRDLMTSYNKAAQLVSDDFANKLPDAMGYLAKVSAATGQGMGYMLDSLVVGVGRLSPMILDNLGIQVSLADATARAAEMFGVEAEELSKAQTQAGMMAVGLEKLAANTASMPEVTGSAAAGFAQIGAQFQNLKDQIGLQLLPVMVPLLEGLGNFAQTYGPQVVAIFQQFGDTMAGTLPQAILLVNDALTRMNAVFTDSDEPVTAMDAVLGVLTATLNAGVIAVQVIAVGMQGLASAIEAVNSALTAATEGWMKFMEAAGAGLNFMGNGMGAPTGAGGTGVGTLGGWAGAPGLPAGFGGGGIVTPPGGINRQFGGMVPGPLGSPQLVMAHGGETVLPTHMGSGGGGGQVIENHIVMTLDGDIVGRYIGRKTAQLQRMGGYARL